MRKIFTNLKSVVALALVAAMTLSVSCMYDDTALTKRVDKVEKNLAALTEKVNALDVEAVQSLINGLTVITGVTTDEAGNTVVTLSNGESFTVLAECAGLQYRTENGVLELSADGETWVAVTADAACLVKEVRTNADGTVTLVLADGTEFTGAVAELIECEATRSAVYVIPGDTKAVRFTVNDAVADINVMNQPFGWSATVEEYVAPEEPDYDDDFGVLAVGGTEYVLNINAPSAELVRAGFAAKEGVVSVHFNTAAGACKVLKVAVNLAEITLAVENGVVTLTNSVAFEQTNRWGETYTDFADFAIGVMEASAYKQYGDKVFVETFDDWDGTYLANVNFTHRTSGFQNVVDLMFYEDGTCEKESYTFTVEQLAAMMYPAYNFELGGEYIIFVTFDTELVNYYEHPVLTNALMVDYKNTVMSANYVSSTWNGANYEFNLAGYSHYILGWAMKQEVDMYIEYGIVSSLADYLSLFAADMGGVAGLPGTLVAGPLAGTYNLADLRAMSMTGWAPEIYSETEYYFYIYPLNIESEMDLYSSVDKANIFEFGTFETTGFTAGEFETGFNCEVNEISASYINVTGTFNENVVSYYCEWFDYKPLDVEERIAYMLENAYFTSTEYGALESGHYPQAYPTYLCVIALNANGEYVYVEQKFEYELPKVELVSAVATYQENDPNWYALAFTDAEGNVITTTAGNGGVNYLNAGIWDFSNWYSSGFALGNSYYNDAFISAISMEVAHVDDQYSIVITIPQGVFTYTGAIEGFIVPEPVVLPNTENLTLSLANYAAYSGYCDIAFADAEGKNALVLSFNDCPLVDCTYTVETSSGNSTTPGTMYLNGCYVEYDGYQAGTSATLKSGSVEVKANGDGTYTITFDLVLSNDQVYSGVFNGAI